MFGLLAICLACGEETTLGDDNFERDLPPPVLPDSSTTPADDEPEVGTEDSGLGAGTGTGGLNLTGDWIGFCEQVTPGSFQTETAEVTMSLVPGAGGLFVGDASAQYSIEFFGTSFPSQLVQGPVELSPIGGAFVDFTIDDPFAVLEFTGEITTEGFAGILSAPGVGSNYFLSDQDCVFELQ